MNNDCNCNKNHGAGVVPGDCIPRKCGPINRCGLFKTEVLPVSVGTDTKGEPFAPKFGAYTNTIVQYLANGAVYFYDSKGIYTKIVENGEFINITKALNDEITARKNADEQLNQAITQTAELLQTNINQLYNKEADDVTSLQTNINTEVERAKKAEAALSTGLNDENSRAYTAEQELQQKIENVDDQLADKQDTLVSGTNIKTINGESLLGEGNIEISGGVGGNDPRLTDTGAERANNLDANTITAINTNPQLTATTVGIDIAGKDLDTNGTLTATVTLPSATDTEAGVMSAADKTKLDSLSASTNLTSVPTASYSADNVNLTFGDENVELTPAVGTTGGALSKAGIMSAFQASQLEALAAAYEAEEKGTVLYEGSASVNNIELSESGLSYDHLIIVAQYMGMGSFALEQQVSEVFYPTDSVKAFQMNATDITTGNAPMVQLIQDIWSITDDGMEIELASALKATVNSETSVEPDTTSHFTITKVVGFGKKLAES